MPTFDIVSEVCCASLKNAVDNSTRQLMTRWDFKGKHADFTYTPEAACVVLTAESEFHLQQMEDIFRPQLVRAGVDPAALVNEEAPVASGKLWIQKIVLKEGMPTPLAKQLVKRIKEDKRPVQTQIQEDRVRVTGKSRDELQQVISLVRSETFPQPLQFTNFKA